ncbi:MAG: cupin domain-containing protein [Alphaproteobacteria bacterium]|nr:cupin domain-containing protein [Alphaproteobacteria bacterium]
MPKPILNIADVEFSQFGHGVNHPGASDAPEKFSARLGDIGRRLGAQKLGYNVTVVPPGKRAWPFHNHRINEEMFLVLDGEGEVRIGAETFPIKKGDVIANPPGGPETAHQIVNTSSADLTYLAVSTRISPEIVDYPDSGKFGVLAELAGPEGKPQIWRFVNRGEASLNYWDGE